MPIGFEFDNTTGVIKWSGTNILDLAGVSFKATSTKSTNYTATVSDNLVPVSCAGGNVTITLPDVAGVLHPLIIVRIDNANNTCTIMPGNGNTIMGAASAILSGETTFQLYPIGTDWRLL